MLQVRNLTKIYKPKKGVPVRALDNVNLTFPQTGMVFLLGKSGSGKSTLLNLLGGLDRYDGGDILIMGESTSRFRQSHFDSYRNTYVGFIFQEYNILDEFSVGTNIALALQLQGQKADSQRVNQILEDVDLSGYGNRKPNELSGGQKQRVAIARALVKNPKIIMADEPTGALDSTTGRQVLSTLKKLSRDKLVIVVSHDREFAEQYADRIIELADGRVIRDVEKQNSEDVNNAVPVYMDESVTLPDSYELTDADREAICNYIQNMVNVGKEPKFTIMGHGTAVFQPTDTKKIPLSQEGYKLIKSRLPLKYAFKMGASSLKHKKFRLVMTILLSCIALILFGLTDTVASYDYVTTAHSSLMNPENRITYAAFQKEQIDEDGYSYWGDNSLTEEDLERIEEETGLSLLPVYRSGDSSLTRHFRDDPYSKDLGYQFTNLAGFVEIDEDILEDMGGRLVEGKLPQKGTNEIALSTVYAEMFVKCGYRDKNHENTTDIRDESDLIGKTLQLDGTEFNVSGIVDTGVDLDEYLEQLEEFSDLDMMNVDFSTIVQQMFIQSEMEYCLRYSLTGLGMIAPGESHRLSAGSFLNQYMEISSDAFNFHYADQGSYIFSVAEADTLKNVLWVDGKERTELKKDEVLVSASALYSYAMEIFGDIDLSTLLGQEKPDLSFLQNMTFTLNVRKDGYMMESDSKNNTYQLKLVGIIPDIEIKEPAIEDEEYPDKDGDGIPDEKQRDAMVEVFPFDPGMLIPSMGTSLCYISPELANSQTAPICQTLSPMPTDSQEVRKLVEFSAKEYDGDHDLTVSYGLMNPISFELKNLNELFDILGQVFFWIGLVFVVFASLLFSNFIAVSITYKKQQIGILRAIGSRSNDVFRIFFAESFCIAMINFVISFAGTFLICSGLNEMLKRSTGLKLTILNIGLRQGLLIFGVCLLVAAVASFLPVRKIAAKRPIDAIRDR